MNKIMTWLSLALVISVMTATSSMALLINHDYSVQLHIVSASGQQTLVEEMAATSDINGKLNFQFSNVPDSNSTAFLMVQIMDGATLVRQSLAPAPTAGQQMQMGVSEISHRQTQAALQSIMGATSTGEASLRAMFPLIMIATGDMLDADADSFGAAAQDAATAFNSYLNMNSVSTTQMTSFHTELLAAMRAYTAANKSAVDDTVLSDAAAHFGMASAQLMTAMMQAGNTAGIDPVLLAAAFDQAGQVMDSSTALASLSVGQFAAMQANYMSGTQHRQMLSQMSGYAAAMSVVGASASQTLALNTAMTSLQNTMHTAQQTFCQQAFGDPTMLPSQVTLDSALGTMQTAMQSGFDNFNTAMSANSTQISTMLASMASNMLGMGGMGGGMMTGGTLSGLGLGMMQTTINGTLQNWSTMMVAATNLLPSLTGMSYTPITTLTSQLSDLLPASMPTAPDLSLLPDGPDKSLLELQYDLMLTHLISIQMATNLDPLDQTDLAAISAANLANRNMIMQGLSGPSELQKNTLIKAMSPMQLI